MPSVTRAFSVFWEIDAVICSIEALVSSTPAACSLDDCDSDCAVALTSSDAEPRASAALLTSPTMWDRRSTICRTAAIMLVVSPFFTSTSTARLPFATSVSTAAAYDGSPPSVFSRLRVMRKATTSEARAAADDSVTISWRDAW